MSQDDKKDLGFILRGEPVRYKIKKAGNDVSIYYPGGITFEDLDYIRDLLIIREDIKDINKFYVNFWH